MRLPRQTLIVPDGTGVIPVPSLSLRWPYGSDVTIPVAVKHQSGAAYDLSGAVAGIMGFRERADDDEAALQVEWTITDDAAGEAEFYVTRAMASLLPIIDNGYCVGVQFRDDDQAIEDAIALPGRAVIDPQVASFDEDVTVPSSQEPLARGLNWRGPWAAGTYSQRDGVTYPDPDINGRLSSFIATAETTNPPLDGNGNLDPAWDYLAERGQQGEQGIQGIQGVQGNPGANGADATATTTVTGAEAIPAGALIKVTSGVAGQYSMFTTTAAEDTSKIVGAAATACSGAGASFQAQLVQGVATSLLSDGTGTIAAGAPVIASSTVSGRVKQGTDGDPALVGYNIGAAVAATLDATVTVL